MLTYKLVSVADCEEQLLATCFAISAPTAFSRTHICHYPNLKHQAHVSHQQPGRNPCGFSSSVAGDGLTGVIAVTRSRPVRRQPTFQCRCSFVAHERPPRERRTNQARLKDFLYYSYLIVSDFSSPNSVKKAICLDPTSLHQPRKLSRRCLSNMYVSHSLCSRIPIPGLNPPLSCSNNWQDESLYPRTYNSYP